MKRSEDVGWRRNKRAITWTRNKRQRRAVKNIVELKIKGTENGAETKEEMEYV